LHPLYTLHSVANCVNTVYRSIVRLDARLKIEWTSSARTHELAEIPLADNIRPAGVCAYVRTDARQERGRRSAWRQRELSGKRKRNKERKREREKEKERHDGKATEDHRHIEVGGYNGSASSGALESPDTPSSSTSAARTRVSGARRSSIHRDITIHTSVGALFTSREISFARSERGSNDYEVVYTCLSCRTSNGMSNRRKILYNLRLIHSLSYGNE